MRIAICDDEPNFVAQLAKLLTIYLGRQKLAFSLRSFTEGEALLRHEEPFDVLFLDINLADRNGLQLASELRKSRPDFVLVFVSAYMDYAPNGYEVQAFRYLLKSKLSISFKPCIDAILFRLGINRQKMEFSFVDGSLEIYLDRIIYLESEKHLLYFHMKDAKTGRLKLYNTLDRVQALLPGGEFIRVHKSYLLNLRYVDNILNYNAYLSTGDVLPVSQKKFANVKREFFRYKGRQV